MGTGNSVACTVSIGGANVPLPSVDQCKELADQNVKDRERVATSDLSPSAKEAVTGGGSTITNFEFRPASGRRVVAAGANRNEATSIDANHFKKGAEKSLREKKKSNLCGGYKYRGQGTRASGHAEARIVESIFSKAPGAPTSGVLLLNVDLKKKQTDRFGRNVRSKMPCGHCHRLLCAAKQCGFKIFLCDKQSSPKELTDDMCEGKSNARVRQSKRMKLKKAMGEA